MPAASLDAINAALATVNDPEINRPVTELGMVKSVDAHDDGAVTVGIYLTVSGCPMRTTIVDRITEAVSAVPGVASVTVELDVMSDEQRAELRTKLRGHEEREIPFSQPGSLTKVYAIASGKGGVGKSSLTANLSVALAQRGHKVAVVDADVWGFSIPRMLGVEHAPVVIDQMLVPPESYGVRCISMGFFVEEEQPVIWRGPMLHKALEQFLTDVFWDEPDFLLVDLPPGTGDIALSLAQFLPRAELYVVTTPQPAAQRVAQRAAYMGQKVNLEVKGVIENMAWFTGDDGKRYEIFGTGGGAELAERLEVPLVGQVPLMIPMREGSDAGRPIMAVDPESEASQAIAAIAQTIDLDLAPTRRYNPGLKLLG